jgi:leader peptidase (prepilin peptidase)/N-methyltransferase
MKLSVAVMVVGLAAPLGWGVDDVAKRLAAGGRAPPRMAVIAAAVTMAAAACVFAPGAVPAPAGALLGVGLLILAATDIAVMRLPDVVTLPLIVVGLLMAGIDSSFSLEGLTPRLIGAAAGYGSFAGLAAFYRWRHGREGLGLGDAKLAACAGAWLGWRALPLVVVLACAFAFAWVAARFARAGRAALGRPLPFGAPLALAIWIVWLLPAQA